MRSGKTKRRDAALASGAQMVSTDYPFDEKAAGSGYSVRFEGSGQQHVRCNPLSAKAGFNPRSLRETVDGMPDNHRPK